VWVLLSAQEHANEAVGSGRTVDSPHVGYYAATLSLGLCATAGALAALVGRGGPCGPSEEGVQRALREDELIQEVTSRKPARKGGHARSPPLTPTELEQAVPNIFKRDMESSSRGSRSGSGRGTPRGDAIQAEDRQEPRHGPSSRWERYKQERERGREAKRAKAAAKQSQRLERARADLVGPRATSVARHIAAQDTPPPSRPPEQSLREKAYCTMVERAVQDAEERSLRQAAAVDSPLPAGQDDIQIVIDQDEE